MKTAMKKNRFLAGFLAVVLALILGAGIPAVSVHAAGGSVYTCSVTPCYRHPVTGVIEDSGGEASYATGQGMVDGCVYQTGILEVTADGKYYLTIRMSLMDYTSGHSFWVQNVGDSGWSSPSEIGITGNGSDSNGTTADICMRVPSENCVVRGSMYVEPMGRDVVFYCYPSDYSEGNSTNMNATMASAGDTGADAQASGSGLANSAGSGTDTGSSSAGGASASSGSGSLSGGGSLSAGASKLQSSAADAGNDSGTDSGTDSGAAGLQSSITEPATSDTTQGTDDAALSKAEGLSLSTADADNAQTTAADTSDGSAGQQVMVRILSITISGLILIAVAAGVTYFFRKNWYRWGGGEDDDDE